MSNLETLERLDVEIKAEIKELNEDGTFKGIASMYDVEDSAGDVIDRGAFTKTLKENPKRVILWQHDSRQPIGEGTLREWQGKILIDAKLDIEDDPMAQHAYRKLKNGRIKGLSIGFFTIKQSWETVEGREVRHIKELELVEVSIVTFQALKQAQVTRVKSAEADAARIAHLEKQLAEQSEQLQALQAKQVATPPEPAQAEEPPQQQGSEPEEIHSGLAVLFQAAKRGFQL